MRAAIEKLVAGGGGGNCRKTPNKNTNDPTSSTKEVATVYRKLNKYCHSCGVRLCNQRGCGTGDGKDCVFKKEGHKDEAISTSKMRGNTRCDKLWNLWCEQETNKKISILPAGAKTQK